MWIEELFAGGGTAQDAAGGKPGTLGYAAAQAKPFMQSWAQEIVRLYEASPASARRLSHALVARAGRRAAQLHPEGNLRIARGMLADFLPAALVTPVRDVLHEAEMQEYQKRASRRDLARRVWLQGLMRAAIDEARQQEGKDGYE